MRKGIFLVIRILIATLLLCCSVILSLPKEVFAFTLPDTGQTKCYDTFGTVIACAGTGQDGEYNINPMSYTDNGDGTITDNVTGLLWQKGENSITYNWYQAAGTYDASHNPSSQNVCGSLTLGGQSDWRLPTKKELITIVDYGVPLPGPTINTTYFPNANANDYWSSTTSSNAYSTGYVWRVYFGSGSVIDYSYKYSSSYVRCVRGEQYSPSFTDNGNGTVIDNATKLMWQQEVLGQTNWDDTLSSCEGLSLGGQTDWRLPNIKELESITDDNKYSPAINTAYFHTWFDSLYVSSTSGAYITGGGFMLGTGGAWVVDSHTGGVSNYAKNWGNLNFRCVRGESGSLCNLLAISSTSQNIHSSGGTGSVSVTASGSSCAWTASSSLSWVTITSGASGTGSGTVTISVAANTTGTARTGNITIAGQTFTITQSAAPVPCTYTIKPASKTFTSIKGFVVVDVSATGNSCTLNPAESYDWITAALSGKFTQNKMTKKWNGKVKVAVTENKSSAARTGTVDMGGKAFTVTQSGKPCILTITPAAAKTLMAGAGGIGSFTVKAPDGCNWTSAPHNAAWLTLTSGSSGSGNGAVNYTGAENTTGKQRTGKINVVTSDKKSKKIFTVVQKKK